MTGLETSQLKAAESFDQLSQRISASLYTIRNTISEHQLSLSASELDVTHVPLTHVEADYLSCLDMAEEGDDHEDRSGPLDNSHVLAMQRLIMRDSTDRLQEERAFSESTMSGAKV